jgi:hypothetical protein
MTVMSMSAMKFTRLDVLMDLEARRVTVRGTVPCPFQAGCVISILHAEHNFWNAATSNEPANNMEPEAI